MCQKLLDKIFPLSDKILSVALPLTVANPLQKRFIIGYLSESNIKCVLMLTRHEIFDLVRSALDKRLEILNNKQNLNTMVESIHLRSYTASLEHMDNRESKRQNFNSSVENYIWEDLSLDEKSESEGVGIYIHGPIGIGKSHLLYLLQCYLRYQRKRYHVVYIN